VASGRAAGKLAPGLAAGQLAPGLAAGKLALGRNSNSRQLERVQVTIDSSLRPDWSSEGVCRPELETDRRGAANGTLLYVVPGGSFPDASGSFPDPP